MENIIERCKTILGEKKGKNLIFILGIVGILIVGLSSLISFDSEVSGKEVYSEYTAEEYGDMLEKRLKAIISDITGSDNVSVMVTMQSGVERVYANALMQTTDLSEEGGERRQQSESQEESYILVEDENGNATALLKTCLAPDVNGVVIVCDARDERTVENVKESVKTVLNISGSRVCVVGRNTY